MPPCSLIIPVPEEKTAETQQKCETANCVPQVAAPAEEHPLSTSADDQTLMQTQEGADISAQRPENASQCGFGRTHSRRGRPPKTSLLCTLKKTSVKRGNDGSIPEASGCQDDVLDADYTPSKYLSMQRSYNS